jgi:hypothetical protein
VKQRIRERDLLVNRTTCRCGAGVRRWKCKYCGRIDGVCRDCHDLAVHCREPGMRVRWGRKVEP